jgi:8-oxo-dGTP pyrophosphatase MutT (NUDIX family)
VSSDWSALAAARAHDPATRVPFVIDGCTVGSVARAHLGALAAWPQVLAVDVAAVTLQVPAAARDATLAEVNAALRHQGLVRGWRDEIFAIVDPASAQPFARIERASARFWGTLTFGAHANGYVTGPAGRPSHLWLARRSSAKATDPGMWDNLVGGGVPAGQTPRETLVREAWEEAGLTPDQAQPVRAGGVMRLRRDIAEGLQFEQLHAFDIELPHGLAPCNQDGEVERFECLPVAQALARAASGAMTVDATLVTLDFALRHRLLGGAGAAVLAAGLAGLLRPH